MIEQLKTDKFHDELSSMNSNSLQISRADHVGIGVNEFETVARWYVEKLDFQLEKQWTVEEAPGITIGFLTGPGGFRLELVAGVPGARNPVGNNWMEHFMLRGWNHVCFWSEDVDATMAELVLREVPTFMPPTDFPVGAAVRVACVQDPEGNVVQFVGPLAGK